jgi:hypothetical protein
MIFQALIQLHRKEFLDMYPFTEAMCKAIRRLSDIQGSELLKEIKQSAEIQHMMCTYESYLQDTRSGLHGKTSHFWIHYTDLVQLFLLFSRACHINDLDLFTYCIREIAAIFFRTNRHKYTRWMVRYHIDLLNMDETHPRVRDILKKGALTVRRTEKSFSRAPVDLRANYKCRCGVS